MKQKEIIFEIGDLVMYTAEARKRLADNEHRRFPLVVLETVCSGKRSFRAISQDPKEPRRGHVLVSFMEKVA